MSAFCVGHEHINALLHFLRARDARTRPHELRVYQAGGDDNAMILGPWTDDYTWEKAAKLLWDENQRSLGSRYGDTPHPYDPTSYVNPWGVAPLPPATIFKACDCYDYQACESSDYDTTFAAGLIQAIRKEAGRRLPGYEEAKAWEITDPRFSPQAPRMLSR